MTRVVCAIIKDGNKFLAVQRSEKMSLPLKWEFPGGKIEANESEINALQREIKEELNLTISPIQRLEPVDYEYPTLSITLIPYFCTIHKGKIKLTEHSDYKWIKADDLRLLNWAEADVPILNQIL